VSHVVVDQENAYLVVFFFMSFEISYNDLVGYQQHKTALIHVSNHKFNGGWKLPLDDSHVTPIILISDELSTTLH
jgi:hypothetical protein